MRKRIVVFIGGQAEHAGTSRESGKWLCKYIPRSSFDVTPVEITHDGKWKVPLGNLPKTGSTDRAVEMLLSATPALPPKQGLDRVLRIPTHSLITLVRGKGGDDGAMHSMGDMLGIRVAGSGHRTSQLASHKHQFAKAISHITATPYSKIIPHTQSHEDIVNTVQSEFLAPFFIKPVHGAGSHGVHRADALADIEHAIRVPKQLGHDILVQEHRPGIELAVTVFEDKDGNVRVLPPTVVTPNGTSYFDYHAKQREGGARFENAKEVHPSVVEQAQAIAQEVYEELHCHGIVTIDMIANKGTIDVLELNTIPTFTPSTPIVHQLRHTGIHPEDFIKGLLL